VDDVSDRPQGYFADQCKSGVIKAEIDRIG